MDAARKTTSPGVEAWPSSSVWKPGSPASSPLLPLGRVIGRVRLRGRRWEYGFLHHFIMLAIELYVHRG